MVAAGSAPPYHEVLSDLLRSIMRAQAELVELYAAEHALRSEEHGRINRHFAWLALVYRVGRNRHLFEGHEGVYSLRTRPLRDAGRLTAGLRARLRARESLPYEGGEGLDADDEQCLNELEVLQRNPTRISQLICASFVRPQGRRGNFLYLKSPLSVLSDYLSVPSLPGTRAYTLLAVRNYLFETFNIYPDHLAHPDVQRVFTVPTMETALSHIATSFRERRDSGGRDPIPAEGRTNVGSLLRHYLASREILWMRFSRVDSCARYLADAVLRPDKAPFDFVRPDHLERLPELGEIINELWGLPIPIRGADTVFRGGLRFASRQGLILGIRGGAGTGKTSVALALGAFLSPFGANTLFMTAEESSEDLHSKAQLLIPDELRRLSFFPHGTQEWLTVQPLQSADLEDGDVLAALERKLEHLSTVLRESPETHGALGPPKPCRAVVVLDGVHDLVLSSQKEVGGGGAHEVINRLRKFVFTCRELRALVVLSAGEDWIGDRAFDYLVDVAIDLTHEAIGEHGKKPDRRLILSKARYQFCSVGSHGLQISGSKGVRISPQINYQLDKRAIWRTRIPDMRLSKRVFAQAWSVINPRALVTSEESSRLLAQNNYRFSDVGVKIFRGANVFLNGEGSSGKAALALKIAIAPSFSIEDELLFEKERVLVVSFLYPKDYYDAVLESLLAVHSLEYPTLGSDAHPDLEVIHLYPGNYRADQLFNRIHWELEAAELFGSPYTAIVIDGLHNVFLQFPEIESYALFWPQLYTSLRSRPISIISTHTTFVLQGAMEGEDYRLDDRRTEPLRHSLVQKTDFRFEIDPVEARPDVIGIRRAEAGAHGDIFAIKTVAAINQPIPARPLLWSREALVLFDFAQGQLPFSRGN